LRTATPFLTGDAPLAVEGPIPVANPVFIVRWRKGTAFCAVPAKRPIALQVALVQGCRFRLVLMGIDLDLCAALLPLASRMRRGRNAKEAAMG
jgi:hypothetical protein